MRKIKLKWILTICIITSFALLTGCSGEGLSEKFDEDKVKLAAEDVIDLVNIKDTDSLQSISTPQMKEALTADALNQIHEELSKGGEFEKLEDISIAGQKDKDTKEDYAVTVVKAKYEDKSYVYTITFNENMELAGLYVK